MRTIKVNDILEMNAEFERKYYATHLYVGKKSGYEVFKLWKKFKNRKVKWVRK